MILLVTPSERASACAAALHEATGENIVLAESLARATTLLRAGSCQVAVLDQHLLESEPADAASTIDHLDTAISVHVNLAITGMDRLVREVRAAVKRRQREEVSARQVAAGKLESELGDTVTALLLSVELALETFGLLLEAAERLRSFRHVVNRLRSQLVSVSGTQGAQPAAGA
jgi:hypothetical protein